MICRWLSWLSWFLLQDGSFLIQSSFDVGDVGVALDACLLDSMQTLVEGDELVMLSSKFLRRSTIRFWISCCMVEAVESMDCLVPGYQCKGPVGRGPLGGDG